MTIDLTVLVGDPLEIGHHRWYRTTDRGLFSIQGEEQRILAIFFFFWPCPAACGILVPRAGIKPMPPAMEARSLNHWTASKVPLTN